eukprot:sb/3468601/
MDEVDMDITSTSSNNDVGELTMMVNADLAGVADECPDLTVYNPTNIGGGKGGRVDEDTIDNMIHHTGWSIDNLNRIVNGNLETTSTGNTTVDETSFVRRSTRRVNKSANDSLVMKTPVVTLTRSRKTRNSRSASKPANTSSTSKSNLKQKLPTATQSQLAQLGAFNISDASALAEFSDIDLLENLTEKNMTVNTSGMTSFAASERSLVTESEPPTPVQGRSEKRERADKDSCIISNHLLLPILIDRRVGHIKHK